MSSPPPLPSCPQCGRRIAAWKKEHCVYCGAAFPPGLKDGFEEPEGLKWVERPGIPADAARKLEMMKFVPLDGKPRTRSIGAFQPHSPTFLPSSTSGVGGPAANLHDT
jgi:hypothetical protein